LPPLLEIRDLRVEIRTQRGVVVAVDGISFDIQRGEAFALVGESGCGKTTALRAVIGLLTKGARIAAGDIRLEGQSLVTASEHVRRAARGRRVAMIFQDPMSALNPVMSVGAQIAEGPRLRLGYSSRDARTRAIELMRIMGIPDAERRADAYPHELSGGMRQRVMIAIALSCEPSLLLCDEPTTALDVTVQDQILRLLSDVRERFGTGLLYVTHDLAVIAQICRRVAVMYAGRLVETGEVSNVFSTPRHPYTRGLLDSVPDVAGIARPRLPIVGTPPDLADLPTGCRFHPRCPFVRSDCLAGDFPLLPLGSSLTDQTTACIHSDVLDPGRAAVPVING
jgi:oligopeptide/dipeptide ABC transporter ATP-binding protein